MASYRSAEDGYEIEVPTEWLPEVGSPDRIASIGQTIFTSRRWGRALSITVGEVDGTIWACDQSCRYVTATTLDQLEQAIGSASPIRPDWGETSGPMAIGGEPARYERPIPIATCLGCPSTSYTVFAIHEGRPIVLAFDYWLLRLNRMGVDSWAIAQEIIDSLRFFAENEGETLARFPFPNVGFALELPSARWRAGADNGAFSAHLTRYVPGSTHTAGVTVWRGDNLGQFVTCERPAGPWERCRIAHARSLRQLEAAVAINPSADNGVGRVSWSREISRLDGERAVIMRINAYEYPAQGGQALAYILAIHDGRPWFIRLWTSEDTLGGSVDEVLNGFHFTH
jgi:hypothetical protein